MEYIIIDTETQCADGTTYAQYPPVGKQVIIMTSEEASYIKNNILPVHGGWSYDDGKLRYVVCAEGETPLFSLESGYAFRLRTDAELWTVPELQTVKLNTLNYDVNVFIGSRYDQGTKDKINAKYLQTLNKETSKKEVLTDEDKAKKTKGETFDAWTDAIMVYYYTVKAQLIEAVDIAELQAITWDFDGLFGDNGIQFADPKISLASFYGF